MLRPSYSELMDIVNLDADTEDMIKSRYSIVIAAAKRARQIIEGAPHDVGAGVSDKAVSVAIREIEQGKIKIYPEGLAPGEEFVINRNIRGKGGVRGGQHVSYNAEAISDKDYEAAYQSMAAEHTELTLETEMNEDDLYGEGQAEGGKAFREGGFDEFDEYDDEDYGDEPGEMEDELASADDDAPFDLDGIEDEVEGDDA